MSVQGRGFKARFGVVFAFEAVLHDFELQRTHRGEQRGGSHAGAKVEGLHHALLQKLLEAGAEFFGAGGIRIADERENLGRKTGNLVVEDAAVLGQRVADAELSWPSSPMTSPG